MKDSLKSLKNGALFGLSALIVLSAGIYLLKATRSSTNPGSDVSPNDLYVTNGETLKASKRNSLVDKSLSCPSGFTAISKNGSMLGCLQNTNHTPLTCQAAIDDCWDSYGGKLPSYNEIYIGLKNNIVNIGSTDKEWTDTATYFYKTNDSRSCGTVNIDATLRPSADIYTATHRYRCFIPR